MVNEKLTLENDKVFQEKWYHSIELFPGRFTNGRDYQNIALTRALLRGCELENMSCLDIGAADFLITLLLLRRGAKTVAAYDREDITKVESTKKVERAKLLKGIFNVNFDYIQGIGLSELPSKCKKLGSSPFDIVVFSGVLYHMFDPLAGLAIVRGLVRNGGLLVIETAAILDNSMAMHFNAEGRFGQGANYFQVSVECLDYLLRFLRLMPLDCIYFRQEKNQKKLGRVGIVCQAVDHCIPCQRDMWMRKSEQAGLMSNDFSEFLDWNHVMSNGLPDVKYKSQNKYLSFHQDTKTVNIFKTIQKSPRFRVDNPDEQIRLKLNAKW